MRQHSHPEQLLYRFLKFFALSVAFLFCLMSSVFCRLMFVVCLLFFPPYLFFPLPLFPFSAFGGLFYFGMIKIIDYDRFIRRIH